MSDFYTSPYPLQPESVELSAPAKSGFQRLSELTLKALMSAGDKLSYGAGEACKQILAYDGDPGGLRARVNATLDQAPAIPEPEVVVDLRSSER